MLPGESPESCASCVRNAGLCDHHAREVLPQLAVNLGWLWLMGEALCEQKRLQHVAEHTAAIEKAKRREGRKRARQARHAGFLDSILAA